jgi:hypothetical protein
MRSTRHSEWSQSSATFGLAPDAVNGALLRRSQLLMPTLSNSSFLNRLYGAKFTHKPFHGSNEDEITDDLDVVLVFYGAR